MDAANILDGINRGNTGIGGNPDITIGRAVKARMAYVAIKRVGVEVDHCERMISEIDRWIREYIRHAT